MGFLPDTFNNWLAQGTGGTTPPVASAKPTITGFLPLQGAQGSTVVIAGTNLLGASQVSINSGAVASFKVDSATQITAVLSSSQVTGKLRVTTLAGTAVSASDFVVQQTSATENVIVDGHSRAANELPRYIGDDTTSPRTGYADGWFARLQNYFAGNPAYQGFTNVATAGDDLVNMRSTTEMNELLASLVAGSWNDVLCHNYINDILLAILAGQTNVSMITGTVQQRLRDYYNALRAGAAAKGALLRIIQFTEPSATPNGFTVAQNALVEQCVVAMRNWLRVNYQALGALILVDLCSDSRFFGLNTPRTSMFYLDGLHYNSEGNQYIFSTFAKQALLAAGLGVPKIIEIVIQGSTQPVVITTLEDNNYSTETLGFETASVDDQYYSGGTVRRTAVGSNQALITRTISFAGTPEEYLQCYAYIQNTISVQYSVNGSGFVTVNNPPIRDIVNPVIDLRNLAAGNDTITVRFIAKNGGEIVAGDCNWDKIVIGSRVPFSGGQGAAPNPVRTDLLFDDRDPTLILVNWEDSIEAPNYQKNTVRLTVAGVYTASVAKTLTFVGTPEEGVGLGMLASDPRIAARYQIDGGAWKPAKYVGSAIPFLALGMPPGSHEVNMEVYMTDGSPLPRGNCNLDFLQGLTRVEAT